MSDLPRHSLPVRAVHWGVALSFAVLLASGASFWSPALAGLSSLLGGGATARWLHPWVGLLFAAGLAGLALRWVRRMGFGRAEIAWMRQFGAYLRHGEVPESGAFNPGQKVFFWAAVGAGAVLTATGLALWFPAADRAALLSWSRLLHAAAFLVLSCGVIFHVYLSTVAFPGTLRAMTRGTVARRWAARHHARWLREIDGHEGP